MDTIYPSGVFLQVDVFAPATPFAPMGEARELAPAQVRAARALLGWTQGDLAARAGVGKQTVVRFEGGGHAPIGAVIEAIRATLEAASVEFIPHGGASAAGGGLGVRLRASFEKEEPEVPDAEVPGP